MCHILSDLSKYVPSVSAEEELGNSSTSNVIQLLFFGDQLTVERARGAKILRSFHEGAISRLEGFVPAVADWHARMTLVKVSNEFKQIIVSFPLDVGCLGKAVLY